MRQEKFSPVLTPFVDNRVDLKKLRTHAENLLHKGIDGFFVCGSTSLSPSLSFSERMSIIQTFGDIPERVIFQVGSLNLEETLELARTGKKLGIRAIAAFPPYYYTNIPQYFIEKYYLEISKIYPTFVYNFPAATGKDVSPETVSSVNRAGGNLVGIKETVNDPAHMLSFKLEFGKDFKVFSGPDLLIMNAVRIGLDGVVASSTNYVPDVVCRIFNSSNIDEMTGLQRKITDLVSLARRYGQLSSNYALVEALQGYNVGDPREPIFPLTKEQKSEVTTKAMEIIKQ